MKKTRRDRLVCDLCHDSAMALLATSRRQDLQRLLNTPGLTSSALSSATGRSYRSRMTSLHRANWQRHTANVHLTRNDPRRIRHNHRVPTKNARSPVHMSSSRDAGMVYAWPSIHLAVAFITFLLMLLINTFVHSFILSSINPLTPDVTIWVQL